MTPTPVAQDIEGLDEVLERLGGVPPGRVRVRRRRPFGEATEQDLVDYQTRTGRLGELVDGIIVEKAMGYYESRLVVVLARFIEAYLEVSDLGILLGPDGMVRVEGQVREPDVAFYSWDHFPGRVLPAGQILGAAPDLAVEILSPGNTEGEMERKRREYFAAGTRLVWEVDPKRQTVKVYTDPVTFTEVGEDGTLDGGEVVPGFQLAVRHWFGRAGQRASS